jgi:hypothetical protein
MRRNHDSESPERGGSSSKGDSKRKQNLRERSLPQPSKSLSGESLTIPPPVYHSEDFNDDNADTVAQRAMRSRQTKSSDERRGSLESLKPKETPSLSVLKTIFGRDDLDSFKAAVKNMDPDQWIHLLNSPESNLALSAAKLGSCNCLEWLIDNIPPTMERYLYMQDPNGQSVIHHLVMNFSKGGGKLIKKLFSERSNILGSTINLKNKVSTKVPINQSVNQLIN